jgi:hypothetical protein
MMPVMSAVKRFTPRFAIALSLAVSSGCLSLDTASDGLAVFVIASGNEQTLQVGATNGAPLVVRALGSSGEPVEGIGVTWSVSPTTGGTLNSMTSTTDGAGFAQVTFTPGNTPGTVTVRATASGLTLPFTITVVAAPG